VLQGRLKAATATTPIRPLRHALGGIRSACTAKPVRLWEAQTGRLLAVVPDLNKAVQFSPDSQVPPEWFAQFLQYMALRRLNAEGGLRGFRLRSHCSAPL